MPKPRASLPAVALLLPLLALPLALSFALSGCGGGGENGGASRPIVPATPAPILSVSAAAPSGLTLTLAESAATVPVGGSVTYTVTLANPTAQPVTFELIGSAFNNAPSGSAGFSAAVTVTGPGGAVLAPPSNTGTNLSTIGPSVTLAPGQSVAATLAPSGSGAVFTRSGAYAASATVSLFVGPLAPSSTAETTATVGPLALTVQ